MRSNLESLSGVRSIRGTRRPTNVSIGQALIDEARSLNVNISQAAEAGLKAALAARRSEIWLQENQLAIESSNAYVAEKGLPLAKYRGF